MKLLAAALALALAAWMLPPAAQAAATAPPAGWLMKADDLARVAAQGPVPAFQWVSCGGPQDDVLPCTRPGELRTFTDYYKFQRWARAGHTNPVLIDYEGWTFTPRWQRRHMLRYLRMAGQTAALHHIFAIAAPVTAGNTIPTSMLAADEQAARYFPVVDIQRQWMTREPAVYQALIRQWMPHLRAAGPHTTIIAGIAADAMGHPVTAATLTDTYRRLRPLVDGFWLNAALWRASNGGTGCATSGCPQVVLQFLRNIGA